MKPSMFALHLTAALALPAAAIGADVPPNLGGVWTILQHDRPGGIFGSPADPLLTAAGQRFVDEFARSHPVEQAEPGIYCVPTGMPLMMFDVAGYPMEIIQQADRITLITEFQMQIRRIHLDGRAMPTDYPLTRSGYSIGHWETEAGRDVLVVTTSLIKPWEVNRWPHDGEVVVEERLSLRRPDEIELTARNVTVADLGEVVLEDRITVNDPALYAEPATLTVYYRAVNDSEMLEYDCVENFWRAALDEAAQRD